MRLLIILLASFHFCFCASTQTNTLPTKNNSGSVKLLDSKYEQSISGYNGVRSTEYYFTLHVNTNNKIGFDSAWIDNRRHPVFISKKAATITNKPVEINQGDTIIIRVSDLHAARANEVIKAPVSYEGKALIRLIELTNIDYLVIKDILLHSVPNRQ